MYRVSGSNQKASVRGQINPMVRGARGPPSASSSTRSTRRKAHRAADWARHPSAAPRPSGTRGGEEEGEMGNTPSRGLLSVHFHAENSRSRHGHHDNRITRPMVGKMRGSSMAHVLTWLVGGLTNRMRHSYAWHVGHMIHCEPSFHESFQ